MLEVSESRFFLGASIDQSAADFHVERHRCARTHLAEPLRIDVLRKSPKAKHRHINRPPFPRSRLDEIAAAAGAVMLAKRLVGFDLYLTGFRTRPLMAVPCVAVHGEVTSHLISGPATSCCASPQADRTTQPASPQEGYLMVVGLLNCHASVHSPKEKRASVRSRQPEPSQPTISVSNAGMVRDLHSQIGHVDVRVPGRGAQTLVAE